MLSRRLLLLAILVAGGLTGCNPAAKLVGKWEVDAKPAAAPNDNPLAAAITAGLQAIVKAEAEVEFKADGTCSIVGTALGNNFSKQGNWKYSKTDGDKLVLLVQLDGDSERELEVTIKDDDHIQMVLPKLEGAPSSNTAWRFKRVKPS